MDNKAILVELNGENCITVDKNNIQNYMMKNNLKSVSDQYIEFKQTDDDKTKVMIRNSPTPDMANLIIFRETQASDDQDYYDYSNREILFIIDNIHN